MENQFENNLHVLSSEFTVEREQVVKQHQRERQELADIMGAVEADEADKEQETRHVRAVRVDELESRLTCLRNVRRSTSKHVK